MNTTPKQDTLERLELLPLQTGDSDTPTLVLSEHGMPILNIVGDIKMPADYSFACINHYVHCEDPMYEDLQYLALGMATHIEALERQLAALRQAAP